LTIVVQPPPPGAMSITPNPIEKLPNGTQQFVVVNGSGPFTWTVNGIVGGNSTFGTITAGGLYTAPATVPSPATFDVCAVQSSPAAQACSHVTITAVPTSGGDLVVFNDVNLFDGTAAQNPNNQLFYLNLVNYTASGPRASQTSVMFYFGHSSLWFPAGVAAGGYMTGFTVNSVFSEPLTNIPSSYKVIFLWTPITPFSNDEVNALKQFSAEGGRVIFVGEHAGFYGSGIPIENALLQKMGAQMTNSGGFFDCFGDDGFPGFPVLPASRLNTSHQIMHGLTGLALACASEVIPGPNDFVLFRSFDGNHVLAGVAKIDLTPLPAGTSVVRAPRPGEKVAPNSLPQATWTDPTRRPPSSWP